MSFCHLYIMAAKKGMVMKKIFFATLCIFIVTAMIACNDGNDEITTTESSSSSTQAEATASDSEAITTVDTESTSVSTSDAESPEQTTVDTKSNTTESTVESSSGANSNETVDSESTDASYDVPLIITFSSINEISDFLTTSLGSPDEFQEYKEKQSIMHGLTHDNAKCISNMIVANPIPMPKAEIEPEGFGASYYSDRNELSIIYRVDGIRYRFIYRFGEPLSADTYNDFPVLTNCEIGDYKVDLYKTGDTISGDFISNSTLVHLVIYTNNIEQVNLSFFNTEVIAMYISSVTRLISFCSCLYSATASEELIPESYHFFAICFIRSIDLTHLRSSPS